MSYEQAVGRANRWREPAFAYKTSPNGDGTLKVEPITEEEFFKKPEPPRFDIAAELQLGKSSHFYDPERYWDNRGGERSSRKLVDYTNSTKNQMLVSIKKTLRGENHKNVLRDWKVKMVTLAVSFGVTASSGECKFLDRAITLHYKSK